MFAAPGTLYVYFSYGSHWCMNAVCGPGEQPHAVLLRAATPLTGLAEMRVRRAKATRDRDLAAGPGRLGQAFGADRALDGTSLVRGPLRIADDGTQPPDDPGVSTRIGLARGQRRGVAVPLLRAGRPERQPPAPLTRRRRSRPAAPCRGFFGGIFDTERAYGNRWRIQSATISIAAGRWPSR